MAITKETLQQLCEPFSARDIEWRVGAVSQDKTRGQALPYLTAHAVERRLDEVLGVENWRVGYATGPAGGVMATLFVRVGDEWIGKSNMADNTDIEAVKGGASDAFKRAAKTWGVGRYLYWYEAPWVALKTGGRYLAEVPVLPDEMLPAHEQGGQAPAKSTPATPAPSKSSPAPNASPPPGASAETAMVYAQECIDKVKKGGMSKVMVLRFLEGSKAAAKMTPEAIAFAVKEIEAL
jgi:hypothetical protein